MAKLKVYIAGPYTNGDVAANVRAAIDAADKLLKAGYAAYCPHLTHFWHFAHPGPWEQWVEHDIEWLSSCDVFVRLPGVSAGADMEERRAAELGLKICKLEALL